MIRERCLALLFAFLLPISMLNAQSVSFLNIPEDAGNLAVGGLSAAGDAELVLGDSSVEADVTYFKWSPKGVSGNIINADAGCRFGKWAVMAEFLRYGNGEYQIFDQTGAAQGTYKPGDLMVGIGAAYAIVPGLAVSVHAKYVSSALAPEVKGSAFCADINAVYKFKILTFAALAANLGSKLNYGTSSVPLPMMMKIGAQNDFKFGEKMQLMVGADVGYLTQSEYDSFLVCAGADLKMFDMFSIRAGYHFSSNVNIEPSYVSAGLGLDVAMFSLSAAYLFGSQSMSGTLGITLGVRF